MHELAILTLVVAAAMAVTAVAARWVAPMVRRVELLLVGASACVVLFVMAFVCAEVVMRYGFNSPIPGHLESSELLMPIIVFFAISYTQSTYGHVGMDLLLDNLPRPARRVAMIVTLLVSIFICSVLAYFSFKNALQLWRYDDVTMSPPYFHTWPSAAAIPIGYALISLRMYLQVLSLVDPRRFPPAAPNATHGAE